LSRNGHIALFALLFALALAATPAHAQSDGGKTLPGISATGLGTTQADTTGGPDLSGERNQEYGDEESTEPGDEQGDGRPHIVQRQFDHKEQVITGSVIMVCLTVMLVTMNNYNTRY
jgi:hypothetical protein